MIVTTRVCDLDEADYRREAQAVLVGLDGAQFEIDLCHQHRGDLESMAARYLIAARRISRVRPEKRHARRTQQDRAQAALVRAWARENGWPVLSDRGRIPEEVTLAAARAGVDLGKL